MPKAQAEITFKIYDFEVFKERWIFSSSLLAHLATDEGCLNTYSSGTRDMKTETGVVYGEVTVTKTRVEEGAHNDSSNV